MIISDLTHIWFQIFFNFILISFVSFFLITVIWNAITNSFKTIK